MDNYNKQCYVDMDGVLADFDKGFFDISGVYPNNVTTEELWSYIDAHGKAKFFSELPWMSGGHELWNFVINNFLKVKILSASGKSDSLDKQNSTGKMMWLHHNIPKLQSSDVIFVPNKHKKRHYATPNSIIIDDQQVVVDEFIKKGGIGIVHKTVNDTVNKLKQYI